MDRVKLLAEFRLTDEGDLRTYSRTYIHYHLRIYLEGVPDTIETVTYLLDPSFKDERLRTITKGTRNFRENIASYGDFYITVTVESSSKRSGWFASAFVQRLSEALDARYPVGSTIRTQEIGDAIEYIRKH